MPSKAPEAESKKRPRGRPRNLSHEAIVTAALAVMEREGYAALSLRSLGQELGVSHTNLYNYVGHIEDVEAEALNSLAKGIPLPVSTKPLELRAELIAHLLSARRLLLRHPKVVYPPLGSNAWNTFVKFTTSWITALVPFAPDALGAVIAHSALISFVVSSAERERTYGPDFLKTTRAVVSSIDPKSAEQINLERILDTLIDRLLPGLAKAASTRSERRK